MKKLNAILIGVGSAGLASLASVLAVKAIKKSKKNEDNTTEATTNANTSNEDIDKDVEYLCKDVDKESEAYNYYVCMKNAYDRALKELEDVKTDNNTSDIESKEKELRNEFRDCFTSISDALKKDDKSIGMYATCQDMLVAFYDELAKTVDMFVNC